MDFERVLIYQFKEKQIKRGRALIKKKKKIPSFIEIIHLKKLIFFELIEKEVYFF